MGREDHSLSGEAACAPALIARSGKARSEALAVVIKDVTEIESAVPTHDSAEHPTFDDASIDAATGQSDEPAQVAPNQHAVTRGSEAQSLSGESAVAAAPIARSDEALSEALAEIVKDVVESVSAEPMCDSAE